MATDAQTALRTSSPAPGRYSDGHNLYLKVAKGGSKSWVFMSRLCGELGLGSATGAGKAGKLSRHQARQKANAIHVMLAEGKDPRAQRKHSRQGRGDVWRGRGSLRRQPQSRLEKTRTRTARRGPAASIATLGGAEQDRDIASITMEDVVAVLNPIWLAKPTIADAGARGSSGCSTSPRPRANAAATIRRAGAAIWC